MANAKMIGTVNGYVTSTAWVGKSVIAFNGTTKDLAESLMARGVKVGTKVLANYGGSLKANAREMMTVDDPRGLWVVRA